MEIKKTKYLIIGAGITGLTFADYIKQDYLIVEKENEVGGYCRTIRRGDFIWDYAGHFFHFKTDEFKNKFLNNVNNNEIIEQDKCTKIIYKNNLIDYPFQTNIHQLDKEEFIDCLYDLFNKKEKENYDNFLDMLYGKFGRSITEKFLRPYNEKLYATDLKLLDKDAMGRFFPYADKEQIINNMKVNKDTASYNNKFLYPRNGAGSFIKLIYDRLSKNHILLNTKIESIDFNKKKALTNTGIEIEYEYLINTIPLNHFLEFYTDKDITLLRKELSYNKVLVFNLGFNKKSKYKKEHWMYIPDKSINYYRIGFYDNILGSDKLSMYIEIGYSRDSKVNDIDFQLQETLKNLKLQGIIDDTFVLEEYSTILMDPAYVHINTNTDVKIKELMKKLNDEKVYSIGRYGAWTYCSMEDSMISAKSLAEKLSNEK